MAGNTNEQTNKSSDINKFLIISLVSTVLLCVIFAGVNYVVVDNLVSQKISKINFSQETLDDSEDAVTDEIARS